MILWKKVHVIAALLASKKYAESKLKTKSFVSIEYTVCLAALNQSQRSAA